MASSRKLRFNLGGSGDLEYSGRRELSEPYYSSFPPAAVLNDPAIDPVLPPRNSAHPIHKDLRVDRHRVSLAKDGGSLVDVLYSGTRAFRSPRPLDTTDPNFASMSFTYVDVKRTINPAVKTQVGVPGSATAMQDKWLTVPLDIEETEIKMVVRLGVPPLSAQEILSFREQGNYLHQIFDRYWRFVIGNGQEMQVGGTEIMYEWVMDQGTRVPPPQTYPSHYMLPPSVNDILNGGEDLYIRPPWTNLLPLPNPSGVTLPPIWWPQIVAAVNSDGWQNLPHAERLPF